VDDQKSSMNAWLWARLRPHDSKILLGFVGAAIAAIVASIDPLLMRHLLDESLPKHRQWNAVITGSLIALCFIGRAAFSGFGHSASFKAHQLIGQDLRVELLTHMTQLSSDWHDRVLLGEKLSRIENDVEEIARISSGILGSIAHATIFFVADLVIMFTLNSRITLVFLPVLPLFLLIRHRFSASLQQRADLTQSENGKALGILTEHLGAMLQLELLGAGERRAARTISSWVDFIAAQWRQCIAEILFSVAVTAVFALSIVLVLGLSIHEYLSGIMSIGSLVAFYAYVSRIFEPVATAMDLYPKTQRLTSSLKRVREISDLEPSILDNGTIATTPSRLKHGIYLNDIYFGYTQTSLILHNISVGITAGERLALIGESGSGKSTLARLLVRIIDPTSGNIVIDDTRAIDYSLHALRQTICYVPQHTILFSGSVRDNLLYANPNANERDIRNVVEAAQLETLLNRLQHGLDTKVGPDGSSLSGGERQRVAIARSLLRNAAVLILDESTSALDIINEKAVLESVAKFNPHGTLVVISHRLKSLRWMDRFVLLHSGRIEGEGTHQKLNNESALYRQLCADEAKSVNGRLASLYSLAEMGT
jgi:ABC-type multidrug transport system fused ATPase/permease subunit